MDQQLIRISSTNWRGVACYHRSGSLHHRYGPVGFLAAAKAHDVGDVHVAPIRNQLHRGYGLIADVSGCTVQSQAVRAAFAQHVAAMPDARRVAVVVGDTPVTGLARRLFMQDCARFVAAGTQGRVWISSGVEPAGTGGGAKREPPPASGAAHPRA